MFLDQAVRTPYGVGKVLEIRANGQQVVVQPTTWSLANGQKPVFYMNVSDVKPLFDVDSEVLCTFGVGLVKEIRDSDHIYVVTLKNWQLANGKSPTLYLNEQSLSKVAPKSLTSPKENPNSFENLFKIASASREAAKAAYSSQKFEEAKYHYASAVDVMRRVDGDMTDEQKGKLFEISAVCNSNLSICSWGSKEYNECILYARNSIHLLESMEKRIGQSELWDAMVSGGIFNEDKLRDLKLKAWRMIGKCEMARKNFSEAKTALQNALLLAIANSKMYTELTDLFNDASKKSAAEEKKQKDVWSKAFKKGSSGKGDLYMAESEVGNKASNKSSSEKKSEPSTAKSSAAAAPVSESTVAKKSSVLGDFLFNGALFAGFVGVLGGLALLWTRIRR